MSSRAAPTKPRYDVVIAGGGVIGNTIGYFLSRDRDRSVAIIDIKKPGNASRASAGGLWPIGESVGLGCGVILMRTMARAGGSAKENKAPAPAQHQLPAFFFDFCLKSNAMFEDLWQRIKDDHGVDFELERTGLKFIIFDEDERRYAERIAASIPHLGRHLRWLDAAQLAESEPHVSKNALGALMFLSDDQVNPYLMTRGCREAAAREGAAVLTGTEVIGVIRTGDRVTGVRTTRGDIACGLLINCAGAWASDVCRMATGREMPITPVKGQIVLSERMPRTLYSCLSTGDCYLAQKANGEVLIGSTTEKTGFDVECSLDALRSLSAGAIRCVPALRHASIKRTWAGLRPGTPDEIPILGPVDGVDGYLNACGHFRTGILTAPITAAIIRALVREEEPPIDLAPFLFSRFGAKPAAALV